MPAIDTFPYPLATISRIPPRMLQPLRAAHRRSTATAAARRTFPALECLSLSVIKQVVPGSGALMATTLTSIGAELESGELALLGSEPWLASQYGIVKPNNHALTSATARFRAFLVEAERDASRAEVNLRARWRSGAGRPRATLPRKRRAAAAG